MPSEFPYDVFLSHSSKDKAVARAFAERLRADGLWVGFDEWVLPVAAARQSDAFLPEGQEPEDGGALPSRRYVEKIMDGLEHSRVLVLCMSANAFGSDPDALGLEAGTFRFRDPLNQERRLIPLRLDDAPVIVSLAQFLYINWLPADRKLEYSNPLDASVEEIQIYG